MAAPENDNIADRIVHPGIIFSISGDNTEATIEDGELVLVDNDSNVVNSVWYEWVSTLTGTVTIAPVEGTTQDVRIFSGSVVFGEMVYEGSSEFSAVEDASYYIQITSYTGTSSPGAFEFTISGSPTPPDPDPAEMMSPIVNCAWCTTNCTNAIGLSVDLDTSVATLAENGNGTDETDNTLLMHKEHQVYQDSE
jgi:hypothetical protein